MPHSQDESHRVIPERELLAYRAALKLQIFRKIRHVFNSLKQREGFTQKDLALALGIDGGLLSRRLSGKNDMRLETFSDLARALECKIDVDLVPISRIENEAQARKDSVYWTNSRPATSMHVERNPPGALTTAKSTSHSFSSQ